MHKLQVALGSMILWLVTMAFGPSASAQDISSSQQSASDPTSQALIHELRTALAALNGSGTVRASRTLNFHATYSLNGKSIAVFKVSHTADVDGNVTQGRSSLSSTSTSTPSRPFPQGHPPGTPGPQWEEKYLFNPAAALANIVGTNNLAVYRSSALDPMSGTSREGIRIQPSPGHVGFIPAQIWFLSPTTHLPEAVAFYAPNPIAGQPRIGSMIVYQQFTEVNGRQIPQTIVNKLRTGQVMTITLDTISEGAQGE